MGTKYSTQATSGYNATPPSDDGATTEANKVKWSTIKTKLTDVLKTFGEAINSALVTALDTSPRAITAGDSSAASDHWRTIQVNTAGVTVTLADAATMGAGYIVSVGNQSSGEISVALANAANTIDTITNATAAIPPKATRTYIVNAASTGYITQHEGGMQGLVPIQTQSAANVAAIDFTTGINSRFAAYLFVLSDIIPQTDASTLRMRVSEDSGANWKSGASDYMWTSVVVIGTGAPANGSDVADDHIAIAGLCGNSTGEALGSSIHMFAPAGSAYKKFTLSTVHYSSTPALSLAHGAGLYVGANAINGVRFFMSSGNITSGRFTLYGIRHPV